MMPLTKETSEHFLTLGNEPKQPNQDFELEECGSRFASLPRWCLTQPLHGFGAECTSTCTKAKQSKSKSKSKSKTRNIIVHGYSWSGSTKFRIYDSVLPISRRMGSHQEHEHISFSFLYVLANMVTTSSCHSCILFFNFGLSEELHVFETKRATRTYSRGHTY
jgi:hypothetical protein